MLPKLVGHANSICLYLARRFTLRNGGKGRFKDHGHDQPHTADEQLLESNALAANAKLRHRGLGAQENAGGGDRTHTILRSLDFESSASASSATPAAKGSSYKIETRAQARVDELATR